MISLFFAVAAGLSPPAMTPAPAPDTQSTIRQLEADWTKATRAKDMAAMDRLMSPDFALTFGPAPGDSVPRAPWLANLQRMTISEYKVDVAGVDVMGDVAVA